MLLCRPALTTELSEDFVPLFLNTERLAEAAAAMRRETNPEVRRQVSSILDTVDRSLHEDSWRPTVRVIIFGVDGQTQEVRPIGPSMSEVIRRYVRSHQLNAGERLVYRSTSPRPPGAGGIQLRVVSRFAPDLSFDAIGRRYAPIYGCERFQAPGRDWITLSEREWSALLPPPPQRVGEEHEIPDEVARQIVLHFYPPFPPQGVTVGDVKDVRMSAFLVSTTDTTATYRLQTVFKLDHPSNDGVPGKVMRYPESWIEGSLIGSLEVDLAHRTISRLDLASKNTQDCVSDGRRYPFSAVAYLVPLQGDLAAP